MNQRKKSSFALLLKVLIRQCGKWFMAVWKAQPNNNNNKYAKTAKMPVGEEEDQKKWPTNISECVVADIYLLIFGLALNFSNTIN